MKRGKIKIYTEERYLEECKKDKKDPFKNNDMEKRKAFYGFWD